MNEPHCRRYRVYSHHYDRKMLARHSGWMRFKKRVSKPLCLLFVAVSTLLCMAVTSTIGLAQASWPADKRINVVIPFGPGGPSDAIGRIYAAGLQRALNVPVIVLNQPGANTAIGMNQVAKSDPDGHTLIMVSTMTAVSLPFLQKSLPYNLERDIVIANRIASTPLVLIVNDKLPANTLGAVIELARAKPNQLTFGSSGVGQAYHLAAELLQMRAKIQMQHVPYKGSAPTIVDLLAGRIDMAFDAPSAALPYIASKQLRVLGVTGLKRLPELPDVPTFQEQGLKDFLLELNWGAFIPSGTPATVTEKLHAVLTKVAQEAEVRAALSRLSVQPSTCQSVASCTDFIRAERDLVGSLIHSLGIQPR